MPRACSPPIAHREEGDLEPALWLYHLPLAYVPLYGVAVLPIAYVLALMLCVLFLARLHIATIGNLSLVVAWPMPEYRCQQERL